MAGEHPCAAPGCAKQAKADQLMCLGHWRRLPKETQTKVWKTWRNYRRDPESYREARDEAIEYLRKRGEGAQRSML